jgi:CheY-like chemotaxis protein
VRLIDDIMDVSRVVAGKFRIDAKPADLVAIARDAMDVIRPSAVAKGLSLEFESEHGFCLLIADPERLQQVISNLLSNAVKFTEPRGKIRVVLRQEASQVVLSVSDTGFGIAPEFIPYVFDRFKQADSSTTRRFGGLGLGLALVRHIVELHGGRVTAMSEGIGKGSTFTVSLPIRAVAPEGVERPRSRPSEEPEQESNLNLQGLRVLVVDDEIDALDLIHTVLTGAGAVLETARSSTEGFESFKSFRPDVLVSDIGMPNEDGFAFIRRIRGLSPREGGRTPSLALTAFAREEDRVRALAAGYTAHVGKPVEPDRLVSVVHELAFPPRRR